MIKTSFERYWVVKHPIPFGKFLGSFDVAFSSGLNNELHEQISRHESSGLIYDMFDVKEATRYEGLDEILIELNGGETATLNSRSLIFSTSFNPQVPYTND